MSNSKATGRLSVEYMTRIALLTALSSILFLLEIPVIAFYKLDFSNLPVLLGAFSMGPVPGLIILGLKALIGCTHSSSMMVGELADFLTGLFFILPAAIYYRKHKTRRGAIVGMVLGILCQVVVSVVINKFLMIPFYMNAFNMPIDVIIDMGRKAIPFVDTEWKLLLVVTAPFNLLKGFAISLVTALIYKPLSPYLHVRSRG